MALHFMDGFDVGDFMAKWPMQLGGEAVLLSTTTRFGVGRSLDTQDGGSWDHSGVQRFIPAVSTIYLGVAFSPSVLAANTSILILGGDAGVTSHLSLSFNQANGAVTLYRGDYTTLIGSSPPNLIAMNRWSYIEVSATIDDTTGACEVRVDGNTVINFSGDTRNGGTATTIDAITLRAPSSSPNNFHYLWDDLYICDDTGLAPYNTFLGEIRIHSLSPATAGSSTQWTPDTGSNFARVNEIPYSAANYVQSGTSGQRDTYAMADLPASVGSVLAVQNNVVAKRTDAAAVSVKPTIKSGAGVYYGASTALITSDATLTDTRVVDPNTSSAWTVGGVNALEGGFEVA